MVPETPRIEEGTFTVLTVECNFLNLTNSNDSFNVILLQLTDDEKSYSFLHQSTLSTYTFGPISKIVKTALQNTLHNADKPNTNISTLTLNSLHMDAS